MSSLYPPICIFTRDLNGVSPVFVDGINRDFFHSISIYGVALRVSSTTLDTKENVRHAVKFLLAWNFYANWEDGHASNNHTKTYTIRTGRKKEKLGLREQMGGEEIPKGFPEEVALKPRLEVQDEWWGPGLGERRKEGKALHTRRGQMMQSPAGPREELRFTSRVHPVCSPGGKR